jgi:ureidoacrylate peracid hydrolase
VEHPSGIPQKIVNKVMARRGRLHAFESIDPETTALVVIDLDEVSVQADPAAQLMIATVNTLALAVREAGGVVAWVLSRMGVMPKHFRAILGEAFAVKYFNDGHAGGGTRLWAGLQVMPDDLPATKSGASAFFPGKCDLHPQLAARGIDTLLIAGLVTNICCESSARDAVELEYKVILVSDALSGQAHGLHEATLATFYRIFGDVRPSAEVIGLLQDQHQGAVSLQTSSRNRQ